MSLSIRDFQRLSQFILEQVGIKISPAKKTMLEGRLRKRTRALGLESFSAYCNYFFDQNNAEDELVHLIDEVTTNKTDFFREPEHFNFLSQKALPQMARELGERPLRVWSAGCSTGEEPYTLSMVLSEFGRQSATPLPYQIFATDICTQVLAQARRAVYSEQSIAPVALDLRKRYLLRSKEPSRQLVRITRPQRKAVSFTRLNFMDSDYGLREKMDIVFCRNVLIYFNRETQCDVVAKFCRHLRPGGLLFLGHSESLHGFTLPLTQVGPTIYRRDA